MMTWTRDLLWKTVNIPGAVALIGPHDGMPAGARGTLLRFATKYARVAFDGEPWPIEIALWLIERAPFRPVVVWSADRQPS